MTYKELMVRTLVNFTNSPRKHIEAVVEKYAEQFTGPNRLSTRVPEDKRLELEEAFADEGSGILAWYVRLMREHPELLDDRAENIQQENARKWGKGRR